MPDGRVIKPQQALQPAVEAGREIQNGKAARKTLERVHRKLGDLPEGDIKQMNAVAAILMYTQIGLANDDIATALGTHTDHVTAIKELDLYRQLSDMFDTNLFEDAKRSASHILAKASANAADKMVESIDSPNEQVAVVAAREVLKMNGVSTENASNKSNKSGLNIRIIRKGENRDESITVEL